MNRFRYKLMQFMQGRYGIDELFYILTIMYVVLMFINVFVHSLIVHIVGLAGFVFAIYRYLSRNIPKRVKENEWALGVIHGARGEYQRKKKRGMQRKDYYFKRCPNCGKTLRLPRIKGKHNTRCPACGCEFSVRILKGKN